MLVDVFIELLVAYCFKYL